MIKRVRELRIKIKNESGMVENRPPDVECTDPIGHALSAITCCCQELHG
jgi:hypothetical protein